MRAKYLKQKKNLETKPSEEEDNIKFSYQRQAKTLNQKINTIQNNDQSQVNKSNKYNKSYNANIINDRNSNI